MFNNKKKEIELYEREEKLKVDERVANYRSSRLDEQSVRSVEHGSNLTKMDREFFERKLQRTQELSTLEGDIASKKSELDRLKAETALVPIPMLKFEKDIMERMLKQQQGEIERLAAMLKEALSKMSSTPVIVPPYKVSK